MRVVLKSFQKLPSLVESKDHFNRSIIRVYSPCSTFGTSVGCKRRCFCNSESCWSPVASAEARHFPKFVMDGALGAVVAMVPDLTNKQNNYGSSKNILKNTTDLWRKQVGFSPMKFARDHFTFQLQVGLIWQNLRKRGGDLRDDRKSIVLYGSIAPSVML
jgi:hypothetical protein